MISNEYYEQHRLQTTLLSEIKNHLQSSLAFPLYVSVGNDGKGLRDRSLFMPQVGAEGKKVG